MLGVWRSAQATLNERKRTDWWRSELGQRPYAANVMPGTAFKPLSEDAVRHAASIRFPVYACGYNWLQSNRLSAKRLAQRITDVIKANNSASYTCEKVILVTHSMGGLVARACSELEGMRGQIAGIVHGVMPATGAPVAYKRVRAGTEGAVGLVLGEDAARMTAVFANSPGALQLLPTKAYPPGWLQLGNGRGHQFQPVVKLPQADPYAEIYRQRGPWWGLVREELINPAQLDGHLGWGDYVKNLSKAEEFHEELGNKYHPNTYSFHGNGQAPGKGHTWGRVRWEASRAQDLARLKRLGPMSDATLSWPQVSAAEAPTLHMLADNGLGGVDTLSASQAVRFEISAADSPGDGTVPVASGAAAVQFGSKAAYRINLDDVGHEGAYNNATARALTLHAILSIAQTVEIKE